MKFHDLKIETLRQAPANTRTEGLALVLRANYLTREYQPTPLGQKLIEHLGVLTRGGPVPFFEKLGIHVIQAQDEFFISCSKGDVTLLQCTECHYSSRRADAKFQKKPNPSGALLPLEKVRTPDCNTIESLAHFLGVPAEQTAKALMFTRLSDGMFIFVVVRGDMQLGEAKLRKLTGDFRLANGEEIARAGAVAGYASPIGLTGALVIVDDLIPQSTNLVTGANEDGYHLLNSNYDRDYSAGIVADVALASSGDVCPQCGGTLASLNAGALADGSGYHYVNIISATAEVSHDEKGLSFPTGVSPFDIYLMQIPAKEIDTGTAADEIHTKLQNAGISVLFDDRNVRAGVKFNDADLIGCPIRITVGAKNLKEGMVELKLRNSAQNDILPISNLINTLQSILETHP